MSKTAKTELEPEQKASPTDSSFEEARPSRRPRDAQPLVDTDVADDQESHKAPLKTTHRASRVAVAVKQKNSPGGARSRRRPRTSDLTGHEEEDNSYDSSDESSGVDSDGCEDGDFAGEENPAGISADLVDGHGSSEMDDQRSTSSGRTSMGLVRRPPISRADVQKYFHLTAQDAARALGVGPTVLKRVCRRVGVSRWPQRKYASYLGSMQRLIHGKSSILPSMFEKEAFFLLSSMALLGIPREHIMEHFGQVMAELKPEFADQILRCCDEYRMRPLPAKRRKRRVSSSEMEEFQSPVKTSGPPKSEPPMTMGPNQVPMLPIWYTNYGAMGLTEASPSSSAATTSPIFSVPPSSMPFGAMPLNMMQPYFLPRVENSGLSPDFEKQFAAYASLLALQQQQLQQQHQQLHLQQFLQQQQQKEQPQDNLQQQQSVGQNGPGHIPASPASLYSKTSPIPLSSSQQAIGAYLAAYQNMISTFMPLLSPSNAGYGMDGAIASNISPNLVQSIASPAVGSNLSDPSHMISLLHTNAVPHHPVQNLQASLQTNADPIESSTQLSNLSSIRRKPGIQ